MKREEVLKRLTNPLTSPAVPACGHRFNRREHLFIVYRTDWDALRKAVPEPLELLDEPLVRFEVMKMPDSTGFGDYTESGQTIPVSYKGEQGEYLHMMYLDNFEATAAGRECSAYPKKWGFPKLYVDGNTLVGTLDYGPSQMRVATATMTYKFYPMSEEEAFAQISEPNFMLKLQPNYDGTPMLAQILRSKTTDCEILEAWTGDARLQLFEHVNCPVADLPVREIVSCSPILTNLTLGRAAVAYDYLKDE